MMKQSWLVVGISLLIHYVAVRADEECMKARNVYFVVLAGGNGERLWPLSRKHCPKQLLAIEANKTLLEQTFDRIQSLVSSPEQRWVVTTANHKKAVKKSLGNSIGNFLIEPAARNTGPAILYTCLALSAIDPEAVVVFLPADAFIPATEDKKFVSCLQQAIQFTCNHNAIALFGVKPLYPATGYGYIEYDPVVNSKTGLFKIKKFHEKPGLALAQSYIQQPTMLWNIGMFCAQVSVFINEFKKTVPEVAQAVADFMDNRLPYTDVPSVSVDYAVMERSDNVWVVPADFTWCDVGNIGVFLSLKQQYQKEKHDVIEINAHNNLIDVSGKLVALVGVDDLCVVQTADALLITKRDEAEKVKSVVQYLQKKDRTDYL